MGAVANEIDVFAEIFFADCVSPKEITVEDAGTFYPITGLEEGIKFNVDIDADNGKFTAKYNGTYIFSGAASLYTITAGLVRFSVFKNETQIEHICTAAYTQAGVELVTLAGTGFLTLETGDIITVRSASSTDDRTVFITNLTMNIMRVGL